MEKKKWPWKRKSSERSSGESDSSESPSSHSERYSDEQDVLRESPNKDSHSPEVTSKSSTTDDETNESIQHLTEKLSAALVNVGAKEDLVKQHAKVAEEAVAGWEKAENEVIVLKQQLEAAVKQNVNLEVRVSHLDGALKECVRQLRQARDDQEKIISEAINEKEREWESKKTTMEKQILELQTQVEAARAEKSAHIDPNTSLLLEALEKENELLKQEVKTQFTELESIIIERDLSTQAAETASKSQLESIKKIAKLETECRRLQVLARKFSNQKPFSPSYIYAESLTDSHSDSGERPSTADIETRKTGDVEKNNNGFGPKRVDSRASALMAEFNQFKNEKLDTKNPVSCSVDIDMMDDFLEMERIVALSDDTKSNTPLTTSDSASVDNQLMAELDTMTQRVAELETKLEKIEAEKIELENSLKQNQDSLDLTQTKLNEAAKQLEDAQKELTEVKEAKDLLEFQLLGMEVESRTLSANVDSLKADLEKEQASSKELRSKCEELENELATKIHESEVQQTINANEELKLKQENLAVAADKLAECQKTIASLGMQLQSLATLEDFLIDTSSIPGFSRGLSVSSNGDSWKLACNNVFTPKCDSDTSRKSSSDNIENGNNEESPLSSSSSSITNVSAAKSRNGFGKFFSRSKSVMELNNRQD